MKKVPQETINYMRNALNQGQVEYGQTNGNVHIIGSSYPNWFRQLKTSKKLFLRALDLIESGKTPTVKQDELIMKIEVIADALEHIEPELIDEPILSFDEIISDRIDNVVYLEPNWQIQTC